MYKKKFKLLFFAMIIPVLGIILSSCTGDLNTKPINPNVITSVTAYQTTNDYEHVLAKLYAGFATTGQQGPAGEPDIKGVDEGSSGYLRAYWMLQDLPTDEAICAWSDPGVPQIDQMQWGSSNLFVEDMYDRIYYEITLANEFISHAEKSNNPTVKEYMAEAKFIRAYCYWNALDLFGGNVPFVTQKNGIGAYLPKPVGADSLFHFITGQLTSIESKLPAPKQNQKYRVDQAAVWTLLAKVYLNEKVYIGKSGYTQSLNYCNKLINSGDYSLDPNYKHLFDASNDTAKGIIWQIAFDGTHIQTYAGTNYIIHAEVGGSMSASNFGIDGGWAGNRVRPSFADLFSSSSTHPKGDSRNTLYTNGQTKDIANIGSFTDGYAVSKWSNMTATGKPGSNPSYASTNFPMFRLGDVYLIYAEDVLRGGTGGSMQEAVDLINKLRERAYGNNSGNITSSQLTLPFLLNERARELYWEATRRTTLRRFGDFTGGNKTWEWKGGVKNGTATASKYNLYPIPSSDLSANPNLKQNPGY